MDSAAVDSAVAAVANTPDYYTASFSLYRPLPDSLSRHSTRDRRFDTAPRTFRVRTTVYRTTHVAIPPYSQSSAAAADFHPRPRSPVASPRTPTTPTRARAPISRASRSPARDRRVDIPPTSPRFRLRAPTFESASPLNDEFLDRPSPRPDGCSQSVSVRRRRRRRLPRTARGNTRTHTKRDDFDRSVRRPSSVVRRPSSVVRRPSSSTHARLLVLVIIIHASSVSTLSVF